MNCAISGERVFKPSQGLIASLVLLTRQAPLGRLRACKDAGLRVEKVRCWLETGEDGERAVEQLCLPGQMPGPHFENRGRILLSEVSIHSYIEL